MAGREKDSKVNISRCLPFVVVTLLAATPLAWSLPAPAVTVVSDTFTGTDGSLLSLHVPDVGQTKGGWAVTGSAPAPTLAQGVVQVVAGAGQALATVDAGIADIDMSVDVRVGTAPLAGLAFRLMDANNHLLLVVNGDTLQFYRVQGGARELLASQALGTTGPGSTHRLGVRATGSTLQGWWDGVLTVKATDTFQLKATRHGLAWNPASDATTTFDNFTLRTGPASSDPSSEPLIQPENLVYQGAFRMPLGPSYANSFAWGGTALAFFPAHNSLLAVGHDWYQRVAEFTIPRLTKDSGDISTYARASFLQPFADVFDGRLAQVSSTTTKVGGLLVSGDALIASAYVYYDANGSQAVSHIRSSLNLADANDAVGPYKVGAMPTGFVSGPMVPIPAEWQAALGGAALTGNCCIPIISRTSLGPSVSVFDPSDVGVLSPVPATEVLGYPIQHPTLGTCESSQQLFNCVSGAKGMVFPDGTRSILFFGRRGIGTYCYGVGGATGACVDPANTSKGPHAYPYVYYVWAYDALDLVAVKQGRKQPWQIYPYRSWTFDLPFENLDRAIMGAAYDPATRRIYLSQARGDVDSPLIHVFSLTP